ncbi:MAG: hypothetical protein BWX80_02927 [Candidatus Hydrogenedentes bacterium ADurb.Bin101]|nr:MAG: hypothetical protein BWX80_02927 [Candidatus Hydrogenedentes bacterium ADurb.Bin101]
MAHGNQVLVLRRAEMIKAFRVSQCLRKFSLAADPFLEYGNPRVLHGFLFRSDPAAQPGSGIKHNIAAPTFHR